MKKFKIIFQLFFCILLVIFLSGCGSPATPAVTTPPMVFADDEIHLITGCSVKQIDPAYLEKLGEVETVLPANQIPSENFQANLSVKGAPIYRYTDESYYEKKILFDGDLLVYYDDTYCIYEVAELRDKVPERRSEELVKQIETN